MDSKWPTSMKASAIPSSFFMVIRHLLMSGAMLYRIWSTWAAALPQTLLGWVTQTNYLIADPPHIALLSTANTSTPFLKR